MIFQANVLSIHFQKNRCLRNYQAIDLTVLQDCSTITLMHVCMKGKGEKLFLCVMPFFFFQNRNKMAQMAKSQPVYPI